MEIGKWSERLDFIMPFLCLFFNFSNFTKKLRLSTVDKFDKKRHPLCQFQNFCQGYTSELLFSKHHNKIGSPAKPKLQVLGM